MSAPQSPRSEAVEQTFGTAREALEALHELVRTEVDTLAAGRYGLAELAGAPIRLFAVLLGNAIDAVSAASDNLTLLSLTGHVAQAGAERAFRVPVDAVQGPLHVSDLVGRSTGYCIPNARIRVDERDLADHVVTLVVNCAGAPADIYGGRLAAGRRTARTVADAFDVAIDELGRTVT